MRTLDIVLFSIFTFATVAEILVLIWCAYKLGRENFRKAVLIGITAAYKGRFGEILLWVLVPISFGLIALFNYVNMDLMYWFMVVTTPVQIVLTLWTSHEIRKQNHSVA